MEPLLLVEFAAVDRFHRAIEFPYFFAFARARGVPVRWIRFGVPGADRFLRGSAGIGLSPGDQATLGRIAREHRAARVLFSLTPDPSLLRPVLAGQPAPRLGVLVGPCTDTAAPCFPGGEKVPADILGFASFAGCAEGLAGGAPPYIASAPDFGVELANQSAREAPLLPFLLLGQECTYDRSLASNPFYADLDLSRAQIRHGCAFCSRVEPPGRPQNLPLPQILHHLEALHRTLPETPGRLPIRLVGRAALTHLLALADWYARRPEPPVDLLFDARADALAHLRPRFEAALTRLAGTAHRLHVALIGIESFSPDDLARYNKGLSPFDNLDAVRALLDLEHASPGGFGFREYGGMSLILFSPWTRVEDLALNLRVIQACGLEDLSGKTLDSRLRLIPGLAVTLRAQRDGLVLAEHPDPLFDTSARNLYDDARPWRFQDPRVEALCRVLLRLATPGLLPDEALSRRAGALLEAGRPRGLRGIDWALRAVERIALADPPAETSPEAILAGLEAELAPAEGAAATAREERWARAERLLEPEDRVALDLALAFSRAGLKPVTKIEPLHAPDVARLMAQVDLPTAQVRQRAPAQGEAPVLELFFGADAARVTRAREATDALEAAACGGAALDDGGGGEAAQEAMVAVGVELGYPACCARAFAQGESAARRWSYGWLHLARRLETPGPVPWELNPFGASVLCPHVPCSLACQASLDLARARLEEVRRVAGDARAREIEAASRVPWLVALRGQGAALQLIPRRPFAGGDGLAYQPGLATGEAPEVALARRADGLHLGEVRLGLRRGVEPAHDLSALAFVWWTEAALQAPWWRRLLALRFHPGRRATQTPAGSPASEPSARALALRRSLLALLGGGDAPESVPALGEARLVQAQGRADGGVDLLLDPGGGEGRLILSVRRVAPGEPTLFQVGPFGVSHPAAQSLAGPRAQAAAAALRRRLSAGIRAALRARGK